MEIFMPPKEVMTIQQIRDAYLSNDYGAELLLKHLLIRVAELEAERTRYRMALGRIANMDDDRYECSASTLANIASEALRG